MLELFPFQAINALSHNVYYVKYDIIHVAFNHTKIPIYAISGSLLRSFCTAGLTLLRQLAQNNIIALQLHPVMRSCD